MIKDGLRNRLILEKLEVLNGERGDPNKRALRFEEIAQLQVLIADLSATARQINSDLAKIQSDLDAISVYDIPVAYAGTPADAEVIGLFIAVRNVSLPINLAGSLGYIITNPTLSFPIDVQVNFISVATVTISTSGVFSFATGGGLAVDIVASDVVTFHAPATADATAAGFTFTFRGGL